MSATKTFYEEFGNLSYYPSDDIRGVADVNIYFNDPEWINIEQAYDLRDALTNLINYHERLEKETEVSDDQRLFR